MRSAIFLSALCVLSYASMDYMSVVRQNQFRAMTQLSEQMGAMHKQLLSQDHSKLGDSIIDAHRVFHTQTLAACTASLTNATRELANCTKQVSHVFAETKNTSGVFSGFAAAITSYCQSNCATRIEISIGNVIEACSTKADREAFFTTKIPGTTWTIQSLFMALKAPCFQVAGVTDYCFPKYLDGFNQLKKIDFNSAATTEAAANAALDIFCSPCTSGLFRLFASAGLSPAYNDNANNFFDKGFSLFCLKEDNQYCIVKTVKLSFLPPNSTLTTINGILCDKCVSSYIASAVEILQARDTGGAEWKPIASLLEFMCEKQQPSNKLCWQLLTETSIRKLSACASVDWFGASTGGSCSANCTAGLQDVKVASGCCAGNLVVLWQSLKMNKISQVSQAANVGLLFHNFAKANCKVDLFEPCASKQVVVAKKIKNMRADFITTEESAKVVDAIVKDVAALANEPASNIKIGSLVFSNNTVDFNVTVIPTLQAQNVVLSKLQTKVDVWDNLNLLFPPPRRSDPLLDIQTSVQEYMIQDIATGGIELAPAPAPGNTAVIATVAPFALVLNALLATIW